MSFVSSVGYVTEEGSILPIFPKRLIHTLVKVFNNGPSKICGRQPLENLN